MNLFATALRLFHTAGVEKRDFQKISREIAESNRRALLIFSGIATVFLSIMIIVSFTVSTLAGSRMLYAGSAVASFLVLLVSNLPARKSEFLTLILMYAFIGLLMAFGIILGTVTVPNEITASYIALLLTAPQMFTDRPWRMYLMILLSDIAFICMVILNKAPVTWSSDIINAIAFGVLSAVLCTYMNKIKVERFLLVETVRFMAENDQLTGLKNRNSYEQRLANTKFLHAASISCVYVDVNGLHNLNNEQGHAAGDRMLQYIATVMQNIFGSDNTYRVGGDEYVAFVTDRSEMQVSQQISALRQAVNAAGYAIAIGMSHHEKPQVELENIVKNAEKNMFLDKEAYYSGNHIRHVRR